MYCDYMGKENRTSPQLRTPDKKLESLHRQFERLHAKGKKTMVICNKGSEYCKKILANPLQDDQYFRTIIKSKDDELV